MCTGMSSMYYVSWGKHINRLFFVKLFVWKLDPEMGWVSNLEVHVQVVQIGQRTQRNRLFRFPIYCPIYQQNIWINAIYRGR